MKPSSAFAENVLAWLFVNWDDLVAENFALREMLRIRGVDLKQLKKELSSTKEKRGVKRSAHARSSALREEFLQVFLDKVQASILARAPVSGARH